MVAVLTACAAGSVTLNATGGDFTQRRRRPKPSPLSPRPKADLAKESVYDNHAAWVQATYITDDTDWLVAKAECRSHRHERSAMPRRRRASIM